MIPPSKFSIKKFAFIAASMICVASNLSSQEFSFTLTFEDAVGHQDSLILGYGSEASDGIDPDFGEENIIAVDWDTTFDVRITDELDRRLRDKNSKGTYHLKRQILAKNCVEWPTTISIDIKCNNWPVTARWKMDPFVDSCNAESVFTSVPPGGWWDVGSYSSLDKVEFSDQEGIEFTKNYESSFFNPNYAYINQDGDSISVFWMAFLGIDNVTVPVHHSNDLEACSIFPNPVSDLMNITGINPASESYIKVFDTSGKLQQFGPYKQQLHMGTLEPGMYYVQITGDRQNHITMRFVKQ